MIKAPAAGISWRPPALLLPRDSLLLCIRRSPSRCFSPGMPSPQAPGVPSCFLQPAARTVLSDLKHSAPTGPPTTQPPSTSRGRPSSGGLGNVAVQTHHEFTSALVWAVPGRGHAATRRSSCPGHKRPGKCALKPSQVPVPGGCAFRSVGLRRCPAAPQHRGRSRRHSRCAVRGVR